MECPRARGFARAGNIDNGSDRNERLIDNVVLERVRDRNTCFNFNLAWIKDVLVNQLEAYEHFCLKLDRSFQYFVSLNVRLLNRLAPLLV